MFWGRKKREEDLERELRSHLELEAQEQRESHASPEEAHHAASRALGSTTIIQEATREAWGFAWLDAAAQDLRYGCRALKHSPGFAAVAILTAALGIGANTSIFSVVNAVLLHPLPYKDAGRLVSPVSVGKDNFMGLGVADFQYAAWRDQAEIWDGIAAYGGRRFTITGNGDPEQLRADAVTPGFLHTLEIVPFIGRDFASADAEPHGGHVALISYGLWKGRLGGDPSILSRTITLDGKPYSIAGVLPKEFEFPENAPGDVPIRSAIGQRQPAYAGDSFRRRSANTRPMAAPANRGGGQGSPAAGNRNHARQDGFAGSLAALCNAPADFVCRYRDYPGRDRYL